MACVDIISGAGTVMSVSSNLPAAYTATGWAAVSGWTAIGELSSIGEFGSDQQIIEYKTLAGIVCKQAGSTNYGNAQVSMALVPEDAGQTALKSAVGSNRSFKIVLNDGTTAKPIDTVMYFAGIVSGFKYSGISDADQILQAQTTIGLNSAVTTVARHATS